MSEYYKSLSETLKQINSTQSENHHSIPEGLTFPFFWAEANFGNSSLEKAFTVQWIKFLANNRDEIKKFHKDGAVKKELTQHLQKYSFLGGSGNPTFVDILLYSLVCEKIKNTYQVDRLDKFGGQVLRWFNFVHASLNENSVIPMFRST